MVIRRKFSREFKLAAVARVRAGESVAEVARACAVNPNDVQRWRRESDEYGDRAFLGFGQRRVEAGGPGCSGRFSVDSHTPSDDTTAVIHRAVIGGGPRCSTARPICACATRPVQIHEINRLVFDVTAQNFEVIPVMQPIHPGNDSKPTTWRERGGREGVRGQYQRAPFAPRGVQVPRKAFA